MSALAAAPLPNVSTPQSAEDVVLVIMGVLVAAAVGFSLYHWWRTGRPTALLLTAGGLVCSLNESLVDILGQCYFPTDGLMAQELFGRAIPVWVVLAYVLFFGFLVFANAEVLKRRPTRGQMWAGIAVFWVLNTVLELPILATDLYQYYGDQPLEVGGFPLVWLTINSLGSFAAAAVFARFELFFTGARQLLLVPLCFVTYMASWTVSMPFFWAVNAGASDAVLLAGGLSSMAFAGLAIDALIRLGLSAPATPDAPRAADRRERAMQPA